MDEWKLSEDERPVSWNYQISKNFLRFEYNALDTNSSGKSLGEIKNFNTLDAFKEYGIRVYRCSTVSTNFLLFILLLFYEQVKQ